MIVKSSETQRISVDGLRSELFVKDEVRDLPERLAKDLLREDTAVLIDSTLISTKPTVDTDEEDLERLTHPGTPVVKTVPSNGPRLQQPQNRQK